ncbi:caspase family protein [Burkholderia sp. AU38729]|uniref:caspase family protein n=1 Tax=Burkholderia sp. AU38729 TaxID=2879633 RepID=UPI001CF4BC62|nr:caspase family protein [Burkholderia sp. AU38729]MCA8067639.1 caspase family protein [Burkholderia sp. AU38729]
MNLAIVIGVSDYQFQQKLDACKNDALIVNAVLDKLGKYDDICFLGESPAGSVAKSVISDFVKKYKSQEIDEVFFYFTGHGARFDGDFFYALSDFKSEKKESGGLRNTELDGLLRNLNPALTVKIVDACYSGSNYIKSEDDIKPVLEKSARDNELKKIYFFHSSSDTETSLAGPKFSLFTESFLMSLTHSVGSLRYRDIMASVADDLDLKKGPRPTFVLQADNTETFGVVNEDLLIFTKDALGLNLNQNIPDAPEDEKNDSTESDIVKLAQEKSATVFCTREEAERNLAELNILRDEAVWGSEICSLFKLDFSDPDRTYIPNRSAIARWLLANEGDSFFASLRYEQRKYTVEEYKEIPAKPRKIGGLHGSAALLNSALSLLGREEKEYRLETVDKIRDVLTDFDYSVDPIFNPLSISFIPKLSAVEQYSMHALCFFSRRSLVLFYSIEHLNYISWGHASTGIAQDWKNIKISLKSIDEIRRACKIIISEATDFVLSDVKSRLAK